LQMRTVVLIYSVLQLNKERTELITLAFDMLIKNEI